MLQFLKCLFGFHAATEIEYTPKSEKHVCRDCEKELRK